jgi:uncharacterized protein YcnI
MKMKKFLPIVIFGLLFATSAFAHVIVKPATVGIGSTQVFTMAVPSEKDIPTVAVKLMLPDGLSFAVPNVKPGWQVAVKTVATGKKITDDDGMQVDEMKPVEIDWTGGSIPAGQRDEFNFQAQSPATPTTLAWKAYQTYQDGSVVAWDQTPTASAANPYSVTSVVDDLSASNAAAPNTPKISWWTKNSAYVADVLSVMAILISGYALAKKN